MIMAMRLMMTVTSARLHNNEIRLPMNNHLENFNLIINKETFSSAAVVPLSSENKIEVNVLFGNFICISILKSPSDPLPPPSPSS